MILVNKLKFLYSNIKSFLLPGAVLSLIIVLSSYYELTQSRKELMNLLENQAGSLVNTIIYSSRNALLSEELVETSIRQNMESNLNLIKLQYQSGQLSNSRLITIASINNLFRINIFSSEGNIRYTNNPNAGFKNPENYRIIKEYLETGSDSLYFAIRQSPGSGNYRVVLASRADDGAIIILTIDGEEYMRFRKNAGIGVLFKALVLNEDIDYLVLENEEGIQAAGGKFISNGNIAGETFLKNAIVADTLCFRIIETDTSEIFEACHPFYYDNELVGLLRVGISMQSYNNIITGITQRIFISGAVFIFFGSLLLYFVFIKQNFELLKKRYKIIETYSGNIIDNVSDGIILLDNRKQIIMKNKAAETLFGNEENLSLFVESLSGRFDEKENIFEIDYKGNASGKNFLVTFSKYENEDGNNNIILLIKDFTHHKLFAEQIKREERLTAMGELASGVAHEIRNPLNTIATIAQQLGRDFIPSENVEDYKRFTKIIYDEIKRINKTVQDFLNFARPEPVEKKTVMFNFLLDELKIQYTGYLAEKNIVFVVDYEGGIEANIDYNKIKQALINIIQNSEEAIENNGKIVLSAENRNDLLHIKIEDDGPGIPEDKLNRIFNLYYTTKASGTGLGLSIVQRIIFEHSGSIKIYNKENKGVVTEIFLPLK